MISRRKVIAMTAMGLIGAVMPALAQKAGTGARFDTDNDGTVDLAEAKKAAADLFDKLDIDKGGTLNKKAPRRRERRENCCAADRQGQKPLPGEESRPLGEQRLKR